MLTRSDSATAAALAAPASEFLQGRTIVLLALLGMSTSVSALLLYSFGAMVVPLQQGLGWSRADIQVAAACISAGGAISVNFVGWLNLRHGMRAVSTVSLVALSLGLLALSRMEGSIGWLYLGYFVLPFIGIGTTPVTWTEIINRHFVRRRGLALSIALCGTGVAAATLPPLVTWAVQHWSWRAAYVAMAAAPLVLTLPLAWRWLPSKAAALQRAASQSVAAPALQGLTFAQGIRHPKFWLCNFALSLMVSAIVGMVTNTVPLLRQIGLDAAQASQVFSAFGIALIAGRLVIGGLVDRFWAPGVAAVALALPAAGCLLFLQADAATPLWLLVLATALVGVGSGAEFDLAAYLVARYFGLRDYGKLFGIHLGLVTVGSALAPFAFAALLRQGQGYSLLLMVCATCSLLGPLLLLGLGPYPDLDAADAAPPTP